MISFWLPPPTVVPVTTARQSQHSNVMTSPVSLSSGNRIYFLVPVQNEPYLPQWYSGGVERVPPHRSVTGNTDPELRESGEGTAPDTGERETATEILSHTQGVAAQNRIFTQSQSERIQARLGKETDASIAADFGMSEAAIRKRRSAQGIAAYRPTKSYKKLTRSQSERVQARLGKETDASIAADFGVSDSTIRSRRLTLGITAYQPYKSHRPNKKLTQSQSDSIQARLGKEPDARLAADFEISRAAIQRRRSAQGITAFKSCKLFKELTQSQSDSIQARLGKESDASIAADFGVSETAIRTRRSVQGITAYKPHKLYSKLTQSQLDSIRARLGKESDASIAADFEIGETTVRRRRNALGITAYRSRELSRKLTLTQSEHILARLGKESDASIAADFEISETAIRNRRIEQGITAYKPHKACGKLTLSQLDSIRARLGKESDASIAVDFGVSEGTIQKRRSAQGIAAHRPRKSYNRLTQSQSDSIQARLGIEPDASIATDFGVSSSAIRKRRNKQRIAACYQKKSHKLRQLHQPPDILPETDKQSYNPLPRPAPQS